MRPIREVSDGRRPPPSSRWRSPHAARAPATPAATRVRRRRSAAGSAPVHGGTMQVAFQSDPDTFDPQVCYDATCWDNMQMMFDRLYDYKTNTTDLEAEAAASMPEVSGGGKVYTIAIRPGMTFANGKPVTAADFVYTFSRICNPATKSPVVGFWTVVAGCRPSRRTRPAACPGIKALSTLLAADHADPPDAAFKYVLAMPHASVIPAGTGRSRPSTRWARARSRWSASRPARRSSSSATRTTGTRRCPTSRASTRSSASPRPCSCWSWRRARST